MRDVVLSAYNRATYLDQTLVTMWEKCVGKSFICACDLSRLNTFARVGACGCDRERACFSSKNFQAPHPSPFPSNFEKVENPHPLAPFIFFFYSVLADLYLLLIWQ